MVFVDFKWTFSRQGFTIAARAIAGVGEATGTWDAKVQGWYGRNENNHLFVLSRFGCIGDTNLHIFITYLYKVYITRPL